MITINFPLFCDTTSAVLVYWKILSKRKEANILKNNGNSMWVCICHKTEIGIHIHVLVCVIKWRNECSSNTFNEMWESQVTCFCFERIDIQSYHVNVFVFVLYCCIGWSVSRDFDVFNELWCNKLFKAIIALLAAWISYFVTNQNTLLYKTTTHFCCLWLVRTQTSLSKQYYLKVSTFVFSQW